MEAKNLREFREAFRANIESGGTGIITGPLWNALEKAVDAAIEDIEEHTKALMPTPPGYMKTMAKKT